MNAVPSDCSPDFQKLLAEVEAKAEKPLATAPLPRE
jgi:hypothetical protein